jgi:ubiquinone/menaquinone biosynthesis C-methylase UbiE
MNTTPSDPDQWPLVPDELDLLAELVPLQAQAVVELGCGAARLARGLLTRWPQCTVTGLEVDTVQHAKNLANPQDGLRFVAAGAQAVPFPDASFDLALMLKSLHHVPMAEMDQALGEVARVLRPGGFLYVSEPVYGGAFNELARLYNDEGVVRPAAQAALDRVLATGQTWEAVAERRFAQTAHFASFEDFAQRMMYPSFADHKVDQALLDRVRVAFEPHCGEQGAHFMRPMHVRLLRRKA